MIHWSRRFILIQLYTRKDFLMIFRQESKQWEGLALTKQCWQNTAPQSISSWTSRMISHDLPGLSLCASHCVPNNAKTIINVKKNKKIYVRNNVLLSSVMFWNHPSICYFHPFSFTASPALRNGWAFLNWDKQPQVLSHSGGRVLGGSQSTLREPTQTKEEPANRKSPGPEPCWRCKPRPPSCEVLQCQPLNRHRHPLKPSSRSGSQQELQHSTFSFNFHWPPSYLVIS